MGITHVIRPEEWLPQTPKHIILNKMLQLDIPVFCHLPTMKQHKKSLVDFRKDGFTSEALLNAVALMGWNPPHREDASLMFNESLNAFLKEEVMTLPEMLHTFNIDKIGRQPV
jgi:glutamyl/glutaminyl-tRNA synthetase